ncbi:MAG: hypothetical protein HXY40_12170 [Chloroflexi bacterium]|nr:hypothetical protein [Chloroflexota bacterium]
MARREYGLFVLMALLTAFLLTRASTHPGYTDAFYYLNAANRLVSGQGLTDAYLWNYVNAPDGLPADAFRYWMPLASLCAAFGMWLGNAPGSYAAAQWPFVAMYAALALTGFWLGATLGGSRRHAWLGGLLMLFSGFFVRFWGEISTFAPYGLVGAWCLIATGLAIKQRRSGWLFIAGLCAGLGHLARADGVLLLLVVYVAVLWEAWNTRLSDTGQRFGWRRGLLSLMIGYLLPMTPWFLRNLALFGAPLPAGGLQAIWFREYDDLFSYPFAASAQTFFADGIGLLLNSRWTALSTNLMRFVAEQGWIVLAPLILVGLWRRRRLPFLRAFWLYVLGLHIVMTFVFAYPGFRGGLFHSSAALLPFWAILGVLGLDDVVDWIARRRRHWRAASAKLVFSGGVLALAVILSLLASRPANSVPAPFYVELRQTLAPDARVMINDPAALYYFTGLGGVVLPNNAPDVIPEIAQRYGATHVLLRYVTLPSGERIPDAPRALWFDPDAPPAFLIEIPLETPDVRLYAIRP